MLFAIWCFSKLSQINFSPDHSILKESLHYIYMHNFKKLFDYISFIEISFINYIFITISFIEILKKRRQCTDRIFLLENFCNLLLPFNFNILIHLKYSLKNVSFNVWIVACFMDMPSPFLFYKNFIFLRLLLKYIACKFCYYSVLVSVFKG